MLNLVDAQRMASELVASMAGELPAGDELVVLEDRTIARSWGWVFFYTSRLWRETGDLKYAIAGNAPFLVERETGRILPLGTAYSPEKYLEAYEQTGNPHVEVRK
jgi:hypothetical protein